MPKKDKAHGAYNEWVVVACADGDILESHKVGRRGVTWDAPELDIQPPVSTLPVPLRRLARQGRRVRHAGRVIFILQESPPPTQNPSIVHHGLTLTESDAAAGRTQGHINDDAVRRRINVACAAVGMFMLVSATIRAMYLS